MTLLLQGAGIQALTVVPSGPVPLLDLEADTLALSDGDPVALWADQSGNGNDFTASGNARPLKQIIGGYAVVVPDGIDDWMDGELFADNLDSFTVIYVFSYNNGNNTPVISKLDVDVDWNYQGWLISGISNFFLYQDIPIVGNRLNRAYGTPPADEALGQAILFTAEKLSNTEMHLYSNGASNEGALNTFGTITSFSNAQNVKLWVEGGVNGVDDSGYGDHPLFALRIYTPALSPTDRAAVEAELAARYGITL